MLPLQQGRVSIPNLYVSRTISMLGKSEVIWLTSPALSCFICQHSNADCVSISLHSFSCSSPSVDDLPGHNRTQNPHRSFPSLLTQALPATAAAEIAWHCQIRASRHPRSDPRYDNTRGVHLPNEKKLARYYPSSSDGLWDCYHGFQKRLLEV